jgi:GNAT superfamily N-acetyltransferase
MALPQTYVVSGANGLYTPALTSILESELGGIPVPVTTKDEVGFMYQVQTGLKYDRRAYHVRSWIKSLLDPAKEIITDKGQLYQAMAQMGAGQYMPETRPLTGVKSVRTGEILIVKPIGDRTGGGRGNLIVTSTVQLNQAKATYRQQKLQGIVSTYIQNPWLHNGRKFHLRLYLLIRAGAPEIDVPYRAELWPEGKIITAAEIYQEGDYDRPQIHDTHMKSTPDDYIFPNELQIPPGLNPDRARASIQTQLEAIAQSLGQIMAPHAHPLPESHYGFEIFGLDLMIQTVQGQPRVLLLEANTRVAYGPVGGQKDQILAQTGRPFDPETGPWSPGLILFSERYFTWMVERGVKPFYHVHGFARLERTFLISGGTGLHHAYLQYILEANGFRREAATDRIGYLHLEKLCHDLKSYDKEVESLPCDLKSVLSDQKRVIANKELLHMYLHQLFPEIAASHIAPTWNIKEVPLAQKDKVLILRPVGAGASCGLGIQISTSAAEFRTATQKVQRLSRELKIKSVIASEYITNPLLMLDGRKFHIRMFFLVRVGPGWAQPFTYDLWTRGRIATAKIPYQKGDWHNKAIHDTHSESTDFDLWFPEDLPDPAYRHHIFAQMETICSAAASIMRMHNVGPYPESRNAFEIFGCDFMVTDTYEVKLIEINDKVGYGSGGVRTVHNIPFAQTELTAPYYPDGAYTFDDFSYDYFSWMFKSTIGPLFLPHQEWKELRLPTFGQDAAILDDSEAPQKLLGAILIQIKEGFDPTRPYDQLVTIAPLSMQADLLAEFGTDFGTDPASIWTQTTRQIGLALIQTGLLFAPGGQLTVEALHKSYDLLYTQNVWIRPDRFIEAGRVASSSFEAPLGGILQLAYGDSAPEFLDEILATRFEVWRSVRTTKEKIQDWAEDLDQISLHLGLRIGATLGAVSRLSIFPTWDATSESRWFNRLTETVPGPVAIIGRLGVRDEFQGQGIGTYLDLVCIEIARHLGSKSVFCDVPPYRVAPLQRMGFKVIMAPKRSRNFPDLTWTAMKYTL